MKRYTSVISPSPFLFTTPTVNVLSITGVLVLVPQLLMLGYYGDFRALINIACCVCAAILVELAENYIRNHFTLVDGTAVFMGLLAGMFFPSTLSWYTVFVCTFCGLGIGKTLFGGNGSYWIHPSMLAVAIGFLCVGQLFPSFMITASTIEQTGSAFSAFQLEDLLRIASDKDITSSLNSSFIRNFGVKVPEGYVTLFWNLPSTIPAFRFNILTLAASAVMLAVNAIDFIIPLLTSLIYGLLVYFFSPLAYGGAIGTGDVLFAFLTSGTLFTVFFCLTDYSTLPLYPLTRCVYAIVAGCVFYFMNGPGGSPVGSVFAVLIMNVLSPFFHSIEEKFSSPVQEKIRRTVVL